VGTVAEITRPPIRDGQEITNLACSVLDQYGPPFTTPALPWSASGGSITPEGTYTAGATGVQCTTHAEAVGRAAIAEVGMMAEDGHHGCKGDEAGGPQPGKRMIRWSGTVPPQKWANFYTKVLTRFASSGSLKLEVSFEAPVEERQAQSQVDEARSGLKELGLDDGATLI
jgi:hypothetical protein